MQIYYEIMKWFTRSWWEYLLEIPKDSGYTTWWGRFNCRRLGHPCGPWYHNVGGLRAEAIGITTNLLAVEILDEIEKIIKVIK